MSDGAQYEELEKLKSDATDFVSNNTSQAY